MTRLEWWWDLDQGFVAPADLLAETFGTEVAGYRATVHLPSVPVNVRAGSFLAPPQGERATSGEPSESWGMVLSSKGGEAIGVVVKRMVLTAEIADASGVDLQQAARSILDDMDTWWTSGVHG